jgi:hypothetical protein
LQNLAQSVRSGLDSVRGELQRLDSEAMQKAENLRVAEELLRKIQRSYDELRAEAATLAQSVSQLTKSLDQAAKEMQGFLEKQANTNKALTEMQKTTDAQRQTIDEARHTIDQLKEQVEQLQQDIESAQWRFWAMLGAVILVGGGLYAAMRHQHKKQLAQLHNLQQTVDQLQGQLQALQAQPPQVPSQQPSAAAGASATAAAGAAPPSPGALTQTPSPPTVAPAAVAVQPTAEQLTEEVAAAQAPSQPTGVQPTEEVAPAETAVQATAPVVAVGPPSPGAEATAVTGPAVTEAAGPSTTGAAAQAPSQPTQPSTAAGAAPAQQTLREWGANLGIGHLLDETVKALEKYDESVRPDLESKIISLITTPPLDQRLRRKIVLRYVIPAVAKVSRSSDDFKSNLDAFKALVSELKEKKIDPTPTLKEGIPAVVEALIEAGLQSQFSSVLQLATTIAKQGLDPTPVLKYTVVALVQISQNANELQAKLELLKDNNSVNVLASLINVLKGKGIDPAPILQYTVVALVKDSQNANELQAELNNLNQNLQNVDTLESRLRGAQIHDTELALQYIFPAAAMVSKTSQEFASNLDALTGFVINAADFPLAVFDTLLRVADTLKDKNFPTQFPAVLQLATDLARGGQDLSQFFARVVEAARSSNTSDEFRQRLNDLIQPPSAGSGQAGQGQSAGLEEGVPVAPVEAGPKWVVIGRSVAERFPGLKERVDEAGKDKGVLVEGDDPVDTVIRLVGLGVGQEGVVYYGGAEEGRRFASVAEEARISVDLRLLAPAFFVELQGILRRLGIPEEVISAGMKEVEALLATAVAA